MIAGRKITSGPRHRNEKLLADPFRKCTCRSSRHAPNASPVDELPAACLGVRPEAKPQLFGLPIIAWTIASRSYSPLSFAAEGTPPAPRAEVLHHDALPHAET